MSLIIPGKLQKQGPLATLEGGLTLGYYDKLLFNGHQFVQLASTAPGVTFASANHTLSLRTTLDVEKQTSYSNYKDSAGNFRFVNGNPTYEGPYTNPPSGDYDNVVVGFDSPITTNVVKFWAETYVPVELIRVDYGYDGEHWYNVPTHEGNISYVFDSFLKLYSTELVPTGQYIYTVDLGKEFTATYWRIRSFITAQSVGTVTNVSGGNVLLTSVSGLPTSSRVTSTGGHLQLAYSTLSYDVNSAGASAQPYVSRGSAGSVDWDAVTVSNGVTTVTGISMNASGFFPKISPLVAGGVALPGWIDRFDMSVYEAVPTLWYELYTPKKLAYEVDWDTSLDCIDIPAAYRPSPCIASYTFFPTAATNCWRQRHDLANNSIRYEFVGDCWDDNSAYRYSYYSLGSLSTEVPFYLTSFNDPFAVKTDLEFTADYKPLDIGPHGGTVYLSATLVSYSGISAPPAGDTVVSAHEGAKVGYSSISGNSIQNVQSSAWDSTTDLATNSKFMYSYPMKLTQVRIQSTDKALLKFWESDGEKAVSNVIFDANILDAVYDYADNVFYMATVLEASSSSAVISDSFSDSIIDRDRWDLTGSAITLDTTNSGILFSNTVYGTAVDGYLTNKYSYSGDFTSTLPIIVTTMSGNGFFGLSAIDTDFSNTAAFVGVLGDWGSPATSKVAGVVFGGFSLISENTFTVSDIEPDVRTLPDGEYKHKFEHVSDRWLYTRTTAGGTCDICSLDVGPGPYIVGSGVSLRVNATGDVPEYSFCQFSTNKATDSGITTSGIDLKIDYTASSRTFSTIYNDGGDHTLVESATGVYTSDTYGPRISGRTDDFAHISSTEYTSVGSTQSTISVLSIVAIDNDGNRKEVSGVTDANGIVIGSLDVLSPGKGFSDYRGRVFLASDQRTEGEGGSLFVVVDKDIFKYNKTTLPLASDDGTSVALSIYGIIDDTNIRAFDYDSFVNGGLHYIVHDEDRDIVVLRAYSSATLLPTVYEAEIDIPSSRSPVALDPVDLNVLYFVDSDSDVYVMNLDPTSVAFTDVVVSDPVIPADSSYQTTVTAHVANLYGDPLSNKLVTFSVTTGGGSVTPATACTTSSGTASTTFTADSVIGTSIITATASNTAC